MSWPTFSSVWVWASENLVHPYFFPIRLESMARFTGFLLGPEAGFGGKKTLFLRFVVNRSFGKVPELPFSS